MKKYIKLLLIPTLLLGTGASRAMAGDEALAAVGGFIGGVLVGKVYDNNRGCHTRDVVVIERGHGHGHSHGKYKSSRCKHKVKYKTVYTREWVPGYWDVHYNRCGDRIRSWVSGYYERVKKRVRVDCGCKGRGHEQREYAYRGCR